jgi:hypothetical protein
MEVYQDQELSPAAAPPPELEGQLTLWDNSEEESAVVRALREGRGAANSGKITLADADRANRIAKMRLLGHSYRHIARQTGADIRTVRAVEHELRRQGKLPAEREELAGQFGEIARISNERLLEALDRNKVPVNILPVTSGVAADKRAMLLGESVGTTVNIQMNINQDLIGGLKAAIQAAMAGKSPEPAVTDGQSVAPTIDIEPLAHEIGPTVGTASPE